MIVSVNGQEQTIEKSQISLAELLEISNVENSQMVSVQLNGEFVKKENYADTYLKDADEIDFLYFMGGGNGTEL